MSDNGGSGLSRRSSLVQFPPSKRPHRPAELDKEQLRKALGGRARAIGSPAVGLPLDIIDLTDSDSDDCDVSPAKPIPIFNVLKCTPIKSAPQRIVDTKTIILESESEDEDEDEEDRQPCYTPRNIPKSSRSHRVIISDSDSETTDENSTDKENSVAHGSGYAEEDDAVLTMNDPPQSRRPISRVLSPSTSNANDASHYVPCADDGSIFPSTLSKVTPKCGGKSSARNFHPPEPFSPGKPKAQMSVEIDECSIDATPSKPSTPKTPARSKTPGKKRLTKKELERQKQQHLASYAQTLFDELNNVAFGDQLPADTALLWNNRLQTTAGRASWHRNSQKVETTSIELSTKVLDSEERVRNTLSHEMCHLACWVIDRKPDEAHGRVFNSWAKKVMKKRPDIRISTRHSYDIAFKYEWQCQTPRCGKIYGRHSNSINTKKSVCGVCKGGELVPLFKTRTRKAKADSKLASDTLRDSPSTLDKSFSRLPGSFNVMHLHDDADSERAQRSPSKADGRKHNGPKDTLGAPSHDRTPGVLESALGKLVAQLSLIDLTGD